MLRKKNVPWSRVAALGLCFLAAGLTACGSGSSVYGSTSGGAGGTGSSGDPLVVAVKQQTNDLVWDPVNQVIYLSVPSAAVSNPNTISVLDPLTGKITKSVSIGNEPDVLALSAGSQYLYVGLDGSGSVQRLTLPDLSPDVSYSLGGDPFNGPYIALDLQAAPVDPHTTAVTSGSPISSPQALGGITIYDDATPRPTKAAGFGPTPDEYDSIQWGSDDTELYAASSDFYTLMVNPSGVTLSNDYPRVFNRTAWSNSIHYDSGTQLVYHDNGSVVDPNSGQLVHDFTTSPTSQLGVMVPDSALNVAFFIYQTTTPYQPSIEAFDITAFTSVAQTQIGPVSSTPLRMIRWGKNGLAFNTYGFTGQVYVVSGSIVASDIVATGNGSE